MQSGGNLSGNNGTGVIAAPLYISNTIYVTSGTIVTNLTIGAYLLINSNQTLYVNGILYYMLEINYPGQVTFN